MPFAHPRLLAAALVLGLGGCQSGPPALDATVTTCATGVAAVQARAAVVGIQSVQADEATGRVVLADPLAGEEAQARRESLPDVFTATGSFVARHGVSGVPLFVGSPKTVGWSQGSLGAKLEIDLEATGLVTRGAPTLDWEVDGKPIGSCRPTEKGACVLHADPDKIATLHALSAAALPCQATWSGS